MTISEFFSLGFVMKYVNDHSAEIPDKTVAILWATAAVAIALAAYFLGSLNFAIIISGKTYGEDIRNFGSKNAGMTNMMRTYGKKAAGLTLNTADLEAFKNAVYAYCDEKEAAVEVITADMEINPAELNEANIELLEKLEPFGEENPSPLFMFRNCQIKSKKSLKDGKYVAFGFIFGGKEYRAVHFGSTFDAFSFEAGEYVDMIASAELNEYNGKTTISIRVSDIRHSDFNQERFFAAKTAYEDYRCGKVDRRLLCRMAPEQAELRLCYDILRKTSCLSKAAILAAKQGLNYCKFRIILDIFGEFGLAETDITRDYAALLPSTAKADLSKSKILADLKAM